MIPYSTTRRAVAAFHRRGSCPYFLRHGRRCPCRARYVFGPPSSRYSCGQRHVRLRAARNYTPHGYRAEAGNPATSSFPAGATLNSLPIRAPIQSAPSLLCIRSAAAPFRWFPRQAADATLRLLTAEPPRAPLPVPPRRACPLRGPWPPSSAGKSFRDRGFPGRCNRESKTAFLPL